MLTSSFRNLHFGSSPLLLPNAWDAGTARLFESLGAKAIATTSAGLCWSQGYPDGDVMPTKQLIEAIRNIARVVKVPLSIDIEAGYSNEPNAVAKLVLQLVDEGVAGINLEDGANSPEILCAKIKAIRHEVALRNVDFFINIRTDVYLRSIATGDKAVEEVIRRAGIYQSAGGDGIFVPGVSKLDEMTKIAAAVHPLPLNIMLIPGLPSVKVLHQHGVQRLSAGSAIAQAALQYSSDIVTTFLAINDEEMPTLSGIDYSQMNRLLSRKIGLAL
jgi:2-methylisocitrate lyase-like PEP mutase family enzyme